jgi:hypothetical protein
MHACLSTAARDRPTDKAGLKPARLHFCFSPHAGAVNASILRLFCLGSRGVAPLPGARCAYTFPRHGLVEEAMPVTSPSV